MSSSLELDPTTPDGILKEEPTLVGTSEEGDAPFGKGLGDDGILIVDWEGPNDPENPKNWSFRDKMAATLIVSAFTFISPVASSMIAPASSFVAKEFGVVNTAIIAMTTSIFVLGFAFGPLFLGPMSEIYGRSRVLQVANLWYLFWNLGCGFAQNEGQLIALRLMAGLGGSAPLAVGAGLISDTWRAEERGLAMAAYSMAPLLGPVVGPLTGAWIAGRVTWRWVFWSTTIVDGAIQLLGLIYLRETYAPVLLERKAAKIRRSFDEDAEKALKRREVRTVFDGADRHWKNILRNSLTRAVLLFVHEPIIQLFGAYMAFLYGILYLFLTTIPSIFEGVYHESPGIAGLHYIAFGIGIVAAAQFGSRSLDTTYAYFKAKNGGVGRPEFRLPILVPGTIIIPIGLLISGWTTQAKAHWIGADIGLALVGGGIISSFLVIQTYSIDTFGLYSASASAALNFLRSVAGFGFPLFAPQMYAKLGYGKGNTVLAVFAIVVGCPAPFFFWKYGERIRKSSRYASKEKQVTQSQSIETNGVRQ